jgi:ATP-dependent helicase HrpB
MTAAGIDDVANFFVDRAAGPEGGSRARRIVARPRAVAVAEGRARRPLEPRLTGTVRPTSETEGRSKTAPLPERGGEAPSRITEIGRRMLKFPVHPRYARMFLAAAEYGCVRTVAMMAALTQGRSFWLRNVDRGVEQAREDLLGTETESDFFLLMRAYRYAEQSRFSVDACRRLGIHAQAARQVAPCSNVSGDRAG